MEFGRVRNSHPLCDPEHTTPSPQPGYSCRGGVGWCWVGTIYLDSVVGGLSGGGTPGPIPNPEAKPSSADGTALDRVWESRTPPTSNLQYVRGPPWWAPHLFCHESTFRLGRRRRRSRSTPCGLRSCSTPITSTSDANGLARAA